MHSQSALILFSILCVSCTHGPRSPLDPPIHEQEEPPITTPDAWWLRVDMSQTERYLGLDQETALVEGRVESSGQVANIVVGESAIEDCAGVMGCADAFQGHFTQEVPLRPGAQVIPVVVTDEDGRRRKAHRSVIAADFLPEGALNPEAVAVPVTELMVEDVAAELGSIRPELDIAGGILARGPTAFGESCTVRVESATQDSSEVTLSVLAGALVAEVRARGFQAVFSAECAHSLLPGITEGEGVIRFGGHISGTPVIRAELSGESTGDTCLVGLQATPFDADIEDWSFEISDEGATRTESLDLAYIEGALAPHYREELVRRASATAISALNPLLEEVDFFSRADTLSLWGTDARVDLCGTFLGTRNGQLMAGIGARVSGDGSTEAPGAPILPGELPEVSEGEVLLDTQLVSQLLFSGWRAGGLDTTVPSGTSYGLLATLSSELVGLHPDEAIIVAETHAELPPVVRAAPRSMGGEADLEVVIPDMRLDLQAEGATLFSLLATIHMYLDLVPNEEGSLVPTVTAIESQVYVVAEPVADGSDGLLEMFVSGAVIERAQEMLDGAEIGLPSFGEGVVPDGVEPDSGGRYLRVSIR